jgi:hypothetical protein
MREKKKGKIKRCGISKNETLFLFVKEKFHFILCSLETIGIFYPMLQNLGKFS